jgi:outer membrane receptor protein involved in Fe transport
MRLAKQLLTFLLLFSGFVPRSAAAPETGTISGTVSDPTGAVIVGAKITLHNFSHDAVVHTSETGQFKFSQVPFGKFSLTVNAPGFALTEFKGELATTHLIHDVHFKSVTEVQELEVRGRDNDRLGRTSVLHYDLDSGELDKGPVAPPQHATSAILQTVPSAVPEENGRIHVRGSEVQPQYVLDGVPIADNLSGTYATEIDIANLRSTQIITGNIPAEFGDKTAAVVNVTSKSGLDGPWRGSLAFSAGSLNSQGLDGEVGGHFKRVGIFLALDGNQSDRFLDPPEIANIHNHGGVAHSFARFDLAAAPSDALRLTLSANGSHFQVPNLLNQPDQRQRQELRDDFEALNWNHSLTPKAVAEIYFFRRSSIARFLDPSQTGTPFFLEQSRTLRTLGTKANISLEWRSNLVKFGAEAYRFGIQERFSLAVIDPTQVGPDEPVLAFSPAQPFLLHAAKAGVRQAIFLQDHLHFGEHLTADAGLRLDHYGLLFEQSALSPRVGVAYRIKSSNTIFRASYNRFFQTPPLENLLLSSSPVAASLSSVNATSFFPVPPEHQNMYQFGVEQQAGRHVRLGITRYIKNIRNFSDDQQLFATAIVFPVAIAGADIRGTEVRADLSPWEGWSAYLSYSNARATASGPLVGGLFLGHEADALTSVDRFAADQDERNEAQVGVTYTHRSGMWANFTARYDSGIPTEFDAGDFSGFDARIQQQLDPARLRLKPRTLMNAAGGLELLRESRFPIALQLGINNLTDHFYLYNFRSVFSGTHIGRPREITGRIVFHWIK